MKTETNPRGGGRKPALIPRKQATVMLDEDLFDWLESQKEEGKLKSDIVNIALENLRKKFNYTVDKTKSKS